MKNKRIFISGGAGVIGKEIVPKLAEKGAVVLVGDLKPRPAKWSNTVRYRQGDLNYITKAELDIFEPEIFIHLAATFERSTETYEFWEENYWHNIRLSNHLMSILKDTNSLKRVAFASSYLIYDQSLYSFKEPQQNPFNIKETDHINPRNLTGCAKLQHEIELNFLKGFKQEQFTSVCARIFRGYGKGSNCVVSRWIRDLLENKPIKVYRKEGLFDYIYAEETANGLIMLIEHPEITGIINLGNGKARKVQDIVDILKKYFPSMQVDEDKEDIPFEASQADITLLEKKTGWSPSMQLEDTIPLIIEHEKNNKAIHHKAGNILVTSISKKVPLLKKVKNAANKLAPAIDLIGADIDTSCIGKFFTDGFWHMPPIKDLQPEDLIEYCKTNSINAIIPTRDGELGFFAGLKPELAKNNISVFVSDKETVNYCLDKLQFYQDAKSGLPIMETSDSIDDIKSGKYVVKERYGAGSDKIGINLNKDEAIGHSKKLNNPIYQPFIPGQEYSVDIFIDKDKNTKGVITRKRELVVNGESQITTTKTLPEVENVAREFINSKNFYGHVILQLIIDENNQIQIIECNPRFGGASTLSINSGLDSFYWFLLESNMVDISSYPFVRTKKEIKQIRFPEDIIIVE